MVSALSSKSTSVYYVFFGLLLILVSPLLLFKKKARAGLSQKLGIIPDEIKAKSNSLKGCVWFHAVSVGEFNAVLPLLKKFKALHPQYQLVVSTTTGTGQALAQEKASDLATVIYFPYDLPFATLSWLNTLSPKLVAIAETEIWPGFTHECKERGIGLVVVNGRISPKSFKGYKRFKMLFGPVLRRFDVIGVQTVEEAKRYQAVGGDVKVEVLGNLKFDGLKPVSAERKQELAATINLDINSSKVIVAGSTHEGEESALLNSLKQITDANVRLILVPRHPERFEHVAKMIGEAGFVVKRFSKQEKFSDIDPADALANGKREVYLLDVIGKLFDFYSLATVAFVGGTIAPIGGHSIMEPYAYSVPVVVGPHIEKTRDVASALTELDALTMVADGAALPAALIELLSDSALRVSRGQKGNQLLLDSQGAVDKAIKLLEGQLAGLPAQKQSITRV